MTDESDECESVGSAVSPHQWPVLAYTVRPARTTDYSNYMYISIQYDRYQPTATSHV